MANRVEVLYRQALKTFSRKSGEVSKSFEENFSKLKTLANQITSEDVKLERCLERKRDELESRRAPVTYVEMYEDDNITMGIFIVKAGCRLPLHDHPGMHGILKVIFGTLKIQSYNIIIDERKVEEVPKKPVFPLGALISSDSVLLAEKMPSALVTASDSVCVLTPSEGNLHEIHAIGGPAAFLDILAPPYDSDIVPGLGRRECHYFMELEKTTERDDEQKEQNYQWLLPIASPSDFWSDTAQYEGPSLRYRCFCILQ